MDTQNTGTGIVDTISDAARTPTRWERLRGLIRGEALIGFGVAMLIIFGIVMALVLALDPATLDLPITKEVQEFNFGPTNWLWEAISAPGYSPYNYIIPAVIIAVVALFKRYAEALFLFVASAATGVSEIVKQVVHRGRPAADLVNVLGHPIGYSFPSGHVTQYTLFFGFGFYLIFTLVKRGVLRTMLLAFCAIMIVLVGPSRIWLGAHWASDVLGGYTLGFGLLLLVIWGYRGWLKRFVAQPKSDSTPEGVKER